MPPPSSLEQARRLLDEGRFAQARDAVLRVLRRSPGDIQATVMMGYLCDQLGEQAASLFYMEKAASLAPTSPGAWANLGSALAGAGRADEAVKKLRAAEAKLRPDEGFFAALINALLAAKRFGEAASEGRRALETFPGSAVLWQQLSGALLTMGDPLAALDAARQAARLQPENPSAVAQVLTILNYCDADVQSAATEKPAALGRLLEGRAAVVGQSTFRHDHTREPDRKLRIGFVSADLRMHACSFFLAPLFAAIDREQFTPVCYSVTQREDGRSEELKRLVGGEDAWRHCPGATPRALAEMIAADRIDVLIDLSGLTVGHRLDTFALRPAPVQMTYLGYPATTGLSTIDYRLVDSITDPPGAEARATERLLRIDPCFLCYGGMTEARPAAHPPSRTGPVVFGSFNALQKITERQMRLWSRVVEAVPGSKLAIKYTTTGDHATRDRMASLLQSAGIPADRLVLLPPKPDYREHLESYGAIDIALDTFPYCGTTTTCEALWMGVPVVTLASLPDIHAARVGASLLSAVGLGDLVAADEEQFVRIAAGLSADTARLDLLRSGLRAQMLASPLCDRGAFAARFGAAIRGAWRAWCGGNHGS